MFRPRNKTGSKEMAKRPKKNSRFSKYTFVRPNYRWPYRYNNDIGQIRIKQETPPSPFLGTEEHTLKKIQETSDMIKRQLLMPAAESVPQNSVSECGETTEIVEIKHNEETERERPKVRKISTKYNIEEIHNTIISHITNMSYRKKLSLISSTSSGLDGVIQEIQKQKRLELSKALREMCSNHSTENCEYINSIIPDIGIKLDDLPLEVIAALSNTLDGDWKPVESEEILKGENADIPGDPNDEVVKTCANFDYSTLDVKIEKEEPEIEDNLSGKALSNNLEPVKVAKAVQTDSNESQFAFNADSNPKTLKDALSSMFAIDEEIARLTKLRQSLFTKLNSNLNNGNEEDKRVFKKRKNALVDGKYDKVLDFGDFSEKILVIKIIQNKLIAASESGKLFFLSLETGEIQDIINVIKLPITSICYNKQDGYLFIGSYGTNLKQLNFATKEITSVELFNGVLCMEVRWNFIFIGCPNGSLLRYSLMKRKVEFEERISKDGIYDLIPAQEGARRVLLIGTRNEPVCVRDAMSGLHMRVMDNLFMPTIYCLLLENDFVYCGTSVNDILVFSFHDGCFLKKFSDTDSKGVTAMKIVGRLLFASCYDGNVYVYNTGTHELVGEIAGPGSAILSMEIEKNLIIVGTIKCCFKAILIPDHILKYNA